MAVNHLSELLKLSEAERIRLAQDLCDSIPETSDALPLTPEQIRELEQRLAEHDADPSSSIPWADVRARVQEDVRRAEKQIARGEGVEHEEARRQILARLGR